MAAATIPSMPWTSDSTDGPALSKRARYRRTRHSSSDSSDAGQFLVSNVKFRVSAPPALPLPIARGWNAECDLIRKHLGLRLEDGVEKVLSRIGIATEEGPSLTFRHVPDSTIGQVTVLVASDWEESSRIIWEEGVKQAKKFVDATVLAYSELKGVNIAVEIIAIELQVWSHIRAIPKTLSSPTLVTDWDVIRHKVDEILESHPATRNKFSNISLVRLGWWSGEYAERNPLTIHISLDYDSDETQWEPISEEIRQFTVQVSQHKFEVHMEHSSSDHYPGPQPLGKTTSHETGISEHAGFCRSIDRPYTKANLQPGDDLRPPYSTAVNLGGDLGLAPDPLGGGKFTLLGTLGCWIELKTVNKPTWTKYALTSYNVVRGTIKDPQDIMKADAQGISPAHAEKPLRLAEMESPGRTKHDYAVHVFRDLIEREVWPLDEIYKVTKPLESMEKFISEDRHLFGKIFAASGLGRRSPTNGRLDWALLKPHDPQRIGRNTLPTREEWEATGSICNAPPTSVRGGNLGEVPTTSLLATVGQGGSLYKKGAMTDATSGMFHGYPSIVRLVEDRGVQKSEEVSLFDGYGVKHTWQCAQNGDSGVVVFDHAGRAVGLLFGGQRHWAGRQCFVTPLHDVFEDIKAFSDGSVTAVRIAQD